MKYCPNCGEEIFENSRFCSRCGSDFQTATTHQPRSDDAPNAGFAVLGFFFPIVGLILYLVWQKDYPLKARSSGKGALIGFITNIVLTVCYVIAMVSLATNNFF